MRRWGSTVAATAVLAAVLAAGGPAWSATGTRTSAFEYDPVSGLLTKEIIEPDNPQLRLETAYTHDAFGNTIDVRQHARFKSSCPEEKRLTSRR